MPSLFQSLSAHDLFILAVILVLLGGGLMLYFIFKTDKNDIYCYQLISSRGTDGKQYADINKLGQAIALFVATDVVIFQAYTGTLSEGMMLMYLGYAGAIATWASISRSKQKIDPQRDDEGTPRAE